MITKNLCIIVYTLLVSYIIHSFFSLTAEKDFITAVLTVYSVFFGFYITSFAVFATSKFLSKLYLKEDKYDSRNTLLDTLLQKFTFASNTLLISILHLVFCYILIENAFDIILKFILPLTWGGIVINFGYAFYTVVIFARVTRQSAVIS